MWYEYLSLLVFGVMTSSGRQRAEGMLLELWSQPNAASDPEHQCSAAHRCNSRPKTKSMAAAEMQ